jgi:hypothetical protein
MTFNYTSASASAEMTHPITGVTSPHYQDDPHPAAEMTHPAAEIVGARATLRRVSPGGI